MQRTTQSLNFARGFEQDTSVKDHTFVKRPLTEKTSRRTVAEAVFGSSKWQEIQYIMDHHDSTLDLLRSDNQQKYLQRRLAGKAQQ